MPTIGISMIIGRAEDLVEDSVGLAGRLSVKDAWGFGSWILGLLYSRL